MRQLSGNEDPFQLEAFLTIQRAHGTSSAYGVLRTFGIIVQYTDIAKTIYNNG